jgi:signal transduction histidine kinase
MLPRHGAAVCWLKEKGMMRNLAVAVGQAALLVLLTPTSEAQAQFGTEKEAKAMLEKAVAAVKENKEKALEMFNKGEGGFKDRDLYVFCANASDGVLTAHPYLKGEHLQDIVGKKGYPLGQEIMKTATEGKISEVSYWWPRPGSEKPLEKRTFYTMVSGQNCGVGYYKE